MSLAMHKCKYVGKKEDTEIEWSKLERLLGVMVSDDPRQAVHNITEKLSV